MPWKAYAIIPIDFGWEHLPSLSEVAAQMGKSQAAMAAYGLPEDANPIKQLLHDFSVARDLAMEAGWEGDMRGANEASVFFLPAETDFKYAFVWKQDNNGTTFVVSPFELPWLRELY